MSGENPQPKNLLIKVSPDTREKLDHIRSIKRWTLAAAIDALADHFIATDPQMRADAAQTPAPIGQHLDTSA